MPQNNKQPDNRSVVIWIIVFFVIAMIAGQQFVSLQGSSGNGEDNKPLTTDTLITSEFLQAIEQDRVVSVVYDARNYTVTGTYYPAITAGETGADAFNEAFGALNTKLAMLESRPDGSLTGLSTRS